MVSTRLFKIGELAERSKVSQRTLDYYTTIGLIHPVKRSDSNYRLYSDETLTRLKRIETMKKEKYTLEEIKASLSQWNKVTDVEEVSEKFNVLQIHLQQLEREVKELSPIVEKLKPGQVKRLFKNISPQSAACIEALLLLLGKNSLM